MECKIIRTAEGFLDIKEDWQRIESTMSDLSYFSSFHYNYLWWQSFKRDNSLELFIVVCIHNGNIVGIAPLQFADVPHRLFVCRTLQFLHGGGDYSDFIIDKNSQARQSNIVTELLTEIGAHKNEYDEIKLTHISQHTVLAHTLLASNQNDNLRYLTECPYVEFDRYPDLDSYVKTFLPKKINQYVNRFERDVDYRMVITTDNLIEHMADIHILEKNMHNESGNTKRHSLFENKYSVDFYRSLYACNSNVLSYLLYDNKTDDIICFYTGYVHNSTFHSSTTAYNPKYAKFAVGKIFNYMIFKANSIEPLWHRFDMGTGRYSWKFELTDTFNLLYQYCKFEPRSNKIKLLYRINEFCSAILKLIR